MAFGFKGHGGSGGSGGGGAAAGGGGGNMAAWNALSAALQGDKKDEEDPYLRPQELAAPPPVSVAPPMPEQPEQENPIAQLLASLGRSSGLTPAPQQPMRQAAPMTRRFGFGGQR